MKFCPSCRLTEDEDEPGLVNLHHVYPEEDEFGQEIGPITHHTVEEHV